MLKGVILAGGLGTRLRPLTNITNKHLLPVYNKPMIEYPIQTLKSMGCQDILIITGPEHVGSFAEYLGDGDRYEVRFTYKVQPKAGGIAQALSLAEGFTDEYDLFPVILGDNYFEKPISGFDKPTLITKQVESPERFGVYENNKIIEKPRNPKSNLAVTGLYWYDNRVFDVIRKLKPSKRGELEITDVNNWYLKHGADVIQYDFIWSDMGSFDSLMEVAKYEQQL